MRRNAFTLMEVMAVVTILGVLAGATVWVLAEDARRAAHADAVGQIAHADRMARLAAQRLGAPCALHFDLDGQRFWRATGSSDGEERSHALTMPPGSRIEAVALPQDLLRAGDERRDAVAALTEYGETSIAYSSEGRSVSYALRISIGRRADRAASDDAQDDVWLIFSGLTGQAVTVHGRDEVDGVFATLATGRPHPH